MSRFRIIFAPHHFFNLHYVAVKYLLLLLCCFGPVFLPAQSEPAEGPKQLRAIDAAQWEQATGKLDYSKDLAEAPKPPRNTPSWNPNFEFLGKVLQVLAALIAFCFIAYAVYQMLQVPRNKTVARDGVEITVENVRAFLAGTPQNVVNP